MQNRLYSVNDASPANPNVTDDIRDQGSFTNASPANVNTGFNYSYDEIGELVKDSAAGIKTIAWTVYGKIASITHRTGYSQTINNVTTYPPDLAFAYDAAGNRISKTVKPRSATGIKPVTTWTTTNYVRDAQGNVLSVYQQSISSFTHNHITITILNYNQTEKHIYGSSRLGMDITNLQLIGAPQNLLDTSSHYLGKKQYELSNHLGNVLTVISDKKIPHSASGVTIDGYYADLQSATDYYAFGAPLYGRNYNSPDYRYGFNGKEKDDETYGGGNEYDYGMRVYDPRLGRFLSLDPMASRFAWNSPYAFAENDVIRSIDLEGAKKLFTFINSSNEVVLTHTALSPDVIKTKNFKPLSTIITSNKLQDAFSAATSSAHFKSLIKEAGLYEGIVVKEGTQTMTKPDGKGGASVSVQVSNSTKAMAENIGNLTWELTNAKNVKVGKFQALVDKINVNPEKSISKEGFVKGVIALEGEASFNKLVVLKEGGVSGITDKNPNINTVLDKYNKMSVGELEKNKTAYIKDYTEAIYKYDEKGSYKDKYEKQYDEHKKAKQQ